MQSQTRQLLAPPSSQYDDDVLYGSRRRAVELIELTKSGNESECLIYAVGTYAHRVKWSIKNLIGLDKRIESMMRGLDVSHALPVQRYCWPLIHKASYPLICISPGSTGKTYTHLLYIVSRCINDTPISKTDEIIAASDHLGTFKTDSTTTNKHCEAQIGDASEIDQENFDFDSLGKSELNVTTGKQKEPDVAGQSSTNVDKWGLETSSNTNINLDNLIRHPSYIVVCSNQIQVENVKFKIDQMKEAAYGDRVTEAKRKKLPPIVKTIDSLKDEDELALKCNESEILIATPGSLLRCLQSSYLTFAKCKKVFFDDIDLTLQLHNFDIREIVKYLMLQTEEVDEETELDDDCQVFMYSKKWTDLVKHFLNSIFPQRILLFGSMLEASIYSGLKFDIEIAKNPKSKLEKLFMFMNLYKTNCTTKDRLAIVCNSNNEAKELTKSLAGRGINLKFLPEETAVMTYKSKPSGGGKNQASTSLNGFVMSDSALELLMDILIDITHLIHYELPKEALIFDQRYRLMYKNIKNLSKNLGTTIFLKSANNPHIKLLYDLASRSTTTLNSTKKTLRDQMNSEASMICWRWASSGLCRYEKLSQDDRFGSYCPDRHSLIPSSKEPSSWPRSGQVKITLTHLISPSEFYFWFESHRDLESIDGKWKSFESTGSNRMKIIQVELDKLKDKPSCSVPLDQFSKGKVYGVYFHQETRVDRVVLLDDIVYDKEASKCTSKFGLISKFAQIRSYNEYSKQVLVFKIDYGVKVSVYLRNIFYLPKELSSIEGQCHRGFHIGYKPTYNESSWLYKAKKYFYDLVCVNDLHEITAWIRLNSSNCFWFENMTTTRKVEDLQFGSTCSSEPHKELLRVGFADVTKTELTWLNKSVRVETLSKWYMDKSIPLARYAFLKHDETLINIFMLKVTEEFDVLVRQSDNNKMLIELEEEFKRDYNAGLLKRQFFLKNDAFCIARIVESYGDGPTESAFSLNRCKIINSIVKTIKSKAKTFCTIECLDHGDYFTVEASELYQISPQYILRLPFQAIKCSFADLDKKKLLKNKKLTKQVDDLIFNYAWDKNNQMINLKCSLKTENEIYLYIPSDKNIYRPLISLLESTHKINIFTNKDPKLRTELQVKESEQIEDFLRPDDFLFVQIVKEILVDMVKVELDNAIKSAV